MWISILEYARLAPSATNRQPWRFVRDGARVLLALTRDAPIDGGIVAAHITSAAAALGRSGQWEIRWGDRGLADEWGLPAGAIPVGLFG